MKCWIKVSTGLTFLRQFHLFWFFLQNTPTDILPCIPVAVKYLLQVMISLSPRGAADLDATLGLHQLQFGLCKLQFHLPQLLLQFVLLLVQGLSRCLVPAGGRRLEGPWGAEQVPAVLTAHYFTLHGHTHPHTHVSRVRWVKTPCCKNILVHVNSHVTETMIVTQQASCSDCIFLGHILSYSAFHLFESLIFWWRPCDWNGG